MLIWFMLLKVQAESSDVYLKLLSDEVGPNLVKYFLTFARW